MILSGEMKSLFTAARFLSCCFMIAASKFGPSGSTDFHIKGDGTLVSFSGLKLHRVPFVKIFQLIARCETASVKKNIIAPVIRSDESKAFLPDDFFYGSGHESALLPLFGSLFRNRFAASLDNAERAT